MVPSANHLLEDAMLAILFRSAAMRTVAITAVVGAASTLTLKAGLAARAPATLSAELQISTCEAIGCTPGDGNCAYVVGDQVYLCPGCGNCADQ